MIYEVPTPSALVPLILEDNTIGIVLLYNLKS